MACVAQLLYEAGLEFRYERVSPFVGDTQSDSHRIRNPLGKVPSLREPNGTVVSESQAIGRYLARTYDEARPFYPCDDAERCLLVDELGDFLSFSIGGPFFNWFVVGAYYPRAFRLKTEEESSIFSKFSMVAVKGALARLVDAAEMRPYLLGNEPCLPDFHLFQLLVLSRTFAAIFEMPLFDLVSGDEALTGYFEAMSARPSSRAILAKQAEEEPETRREIFEEFGKAVEPMLKQGRVGLRALLGHEV